MGASKLARGRGSGRTGEMGKYMGAERGWELSARTVTTCDLVGRGRRQTGGGRAEQRRR
jgi:hypothetical protein